MTNTALMGVLFLVLGLAAMFLMFHLWGYPFDKQTRRSAAPRWGMWLHRVLGYLFVLAYVLMMVKMVPRLWEYQVEFPARTTAHIILGFTVGFLLLVKISIVRFFRHFEEWMPALGTSITLCSVLLVALSLPYVLQERALARAAPGGSVTSQASLTRVASLLPMTGLPAEADLRALASAAALASGRNILLDNCVKCHDLRTILAKPRTPTGWWSTVERMAEKPALFAPLAQREMFEVTAYLIAITPDLQRSSKQKREEEVERDAAVDEAMQDAATQDATQDAASATASATAATSATSVTSATAPVLGPAISAKPVPPPIDLARAKRAFEDVCAQCHDLAEVDAAPPTTTSEARAMIQRMIKENDATLTKAQIRLVAAWMDAHYVAKTH